MTGADLQGFPAQLKFGVLGTIGPPVNSNLRWSASPLLRRSKSSSIR